MQWGSISFLIVKSSSSKNGENVAIRYRNFKGKGSRIFRNPIFDNTCWKNKSKPDQHEYFKAITNYGSDSIDCHQSSYYNREVKDRCDFIKIQSYIFAEQVTINDNTCGFIHRSLSKITRRRQKNELFDHYKNIIPKTYVKEYVDLMLSVYHEYSYGCSELLG